MQLQLTNEETKGLVWKEGDWIEAASGSLTFSAKIEGLAGQPSRVKFFFESPNSGWGTKEWEARMSPNMPNGPALMLFYRRGETGWPLGLVSMVNGSWAMDSHTPPASYTEVGMNSKAGAITLLFLAMSSCGVASVGAGDGFHSNDQMVTLGLVGFAFFAVTLFVRWIRGVTRMQARLKASEECGRALLFRVSKNPRQYWTGVSRMSTGRL